MANEFYASNQFLNRIMTTENCDCCGLRSIRVCSPVRPAVEKPRTGRSKLDQAIVIRMSQKRSRDTEESHSKKSRTESEPKESSPNRANPRNFHTLVVRIRDCNYPIDTQILHKIFSRHGKAWSVRLHSVTFAGAKNSSLLAEWCTSAR